MGLIRDPEKSATLLGWNLLCTTRIQIGQFIRTQIQEIQCFPQKTRFEGSVAFFPAPVTSHCTVPTFKEYSRPKGLPERVDALLELGRLSKRP
jgi:hypothetical protein